MATVDNIHDLCRKDSVLNSAARSQIRCKKSRFKLQRHVRTWSCGCHHPAKGEERRTKNVIKNDPEHYLLRHQQLRNVRRRDTEILKTYTYKYLTPSFSNRLIRNSHDWNSWTKQQVESQSKKRAWWSRFIVSAKSISRCLQLPAKPRYDRSSNSMAGSSLRLKPLSRNFMISLLRRLQFNCRWLVSKRDHLHY